MPIDSGLVERPSLRILKSDFLRELRYGVLRCVARVHVDGLRPAVKEEKSVRRNVFVLSFQENPIRRNIYYFHIIYLLIIE